MNRTATWIGALVALGGCGGQEPPAARSVPMAATPPVDPHSFARPAEVRVTHLDLDLTVDFEARRLRGTATLSLERAPGAGELRLDTRQLEVAAVTLHSEGRAEDQPGGEPAVFTLGEESPFLGRGLTVALGPATTAVRIEYQTLPGAAALQWLEPAQTAGGRHPFLFTQSQAILARTWVPCQDTPAVRMTYEATIRVPPPLVALMSAENPTAPSADGVYAFRMPQAVPSYLLALAVGELEFRSMGPRTGVWAEPALAAAAAWEFAETEAMMEAAERLYGPYRWGRYDLLVLPPSFPYGGMENPRLTFLTPTVIAGDRSLVALIAHELAHSWSGNLVTNATWNDFWLNEGFTSYIENRLIEEVKGAEYAEMLRALSLQDLEDELAGLAERDTHLWLDLAGRDPDDGMTSVAYDKGAALLRLLEETLGRETWDAYVGDYFDRFAFRSIDTATFVADLEARLLSARPDDAAAIDLQGWVYGPGLPANHPLPESRAFEAVDAELARWRDGAPAAELATAGWVTQQWQHFLRNLPDPLPAAGLADLDRAFGLSTSGNSEVLSAWLTVAIRHDYRPAYPALETFLTTVGRRKFLKPLYAELARTEDGLAWARRVYANARPGYHSVSTNTIDEILGWEESGRKQAG